MNKKTDNHLTLLASLPIFQKLPAASLSMLEDILLLKKKVLHDIVNGKKAGF